MNYKILIASHKDYINKTNIVNNIKNTGTPDNKVVFVVSGSDGESNSQFLHSPRNFWEYGALLRAAEYEYSPPEYWLLIHDTVLFADDFFDRVDSIEFDHSYDVVSINPSNQFNIGFYKHDFLVSIKDYLLSLEGMTKEEGIRVEVEGRIKAKSNNVSHLMEEDIHCQAKVKPWGDVEREEFYIRPLGLYKYLAYIGGGYGDVRGFFATHPERP